MISMESTILSRGKKQFLDLFAELRIRFFHFQFLSFNLNF